MPERATTLPKKTRAGKRAGAEPLVAEGVEKGVVLAAPVEVLPEGVVKRGRGRPRKNPALSAPVPAVPADATLETPEIQAKVR